MNRFVKNNIGLLSVLGAAGVIVLVLLVFMLLANLDMMEAARQTEEYQKKIESLNSKKPAPVQENIVALDKDFAFYEAKNKELNKKFGHIFEEPLKDFFAALGKSEEEFLKDFHAKWEELEEKDRRSSHGRYQFTSKIKNEYGDAWGKALAAFAAGAKHCTQEEISKGREEEILFGALGLRRELEGKNDFCIDFINQMHRKVTELLEEKKVELGGKADFSFNPSEKYAVEDIPHVVKNYEVISDVCKLISESGVKQLGSFSRRTLAPREEDGYLYYHYNFEVTGSLESIRKLCSLLNRSTSRNRTYVIQSVFLYALQDKAEEVLLDDDEALNRRFGIEPQDTKQESKAAPGFGRRRNSAPKQAVRSKEDREFDEMQKQALADFLAKREREKGLDPKERSAYGEVLFGGVDMFRAVFDIEYVELAGHDLK